MTPEEESTEHGLRHDVQDTVEDGLGIWRDEISALANSPCDWVQEPEEDGPYTADEVGLVNVGTNGHGVLARRPGYGVGNPEECDAAEYEVAPLYAC